MEKINLNENWCICCTDDAKCFYSDVPATVANTLYENGEIEDPYYGENEWKTYDVLKKDYEFTNTFSVSNKVISSDKVLLRFEGLDTAADIYLNDQHLAFVNDMNRTYEFDVKDILKEGENSIRILFHSNIEYALEQHRKEPYYTTSDTVDGFSLVRKAHCTYGWDWGPKLPDMGIWRPVSIVAYNLAKFEDVYVRQHHHEGNVEVQFDVAFERLANGKETELEISIVSPEGNCIEQKYCGIKTKDSYTIQKTDRTVRESELQLYPCVEADFTEVLKNKATFRSQYLEYILYEGENETSRGTLLFCRPKHFEFADPGLTYTVEENEDSYILRFRTENYAKYVVLEAEKFDFVASDNCFDISKGEEKVIEIKKVDITKDGETIQIQPSDFETLTILNAFDIK